MARLAILALVLAASGCAGGGASEEPARESEPRQPPAWLEGEYADDRLTFRYPGWWKTSSSEKYGTLLSDNRSRHPAFVSVRYFREGSLPVDDDIADRAGRILRPPDGRGLTLLYTQTARLGRLRGVEATFVWQTDASTPVGPTFRTFAVELASGRTAFLVFAAERPKYHGGMFGWVRKTIRWTDVPGRVAGASVERKGRPAGGRYVNER